MGSVIKCFMLAPTDRAKRWLRRFVFVDGKPCPLMAGQHSYHQKLVPVEDGPLHVSPDRGTISTDNLPRDDPRWPTHCSCGYEFGPDAYPQTFFAAIYLTPEGKEVVIRDCEDLDGAEPAPPGAMWYADWFSWKGPDGRSLAVMTPGGVWLVDGPASNSNRPWQRTGTPPNVTANPSIQIGTRYHGWLRDGALVEC